MSEWKDFFKGKRVTVMGLGLLGRGLGDAIFLAKTGAELIVTDLRDEKTLASSLAKLKRFKNIRYTLGQHKLENFRHRDFIVKAAGVPLDSPYIAEARKHKVPVEMDASLFAKLMPKGVTLVGVTGTRGKSTVTALIYEILLAGLPSFLRRGKGVVGVKDKGFPPRRIRPLAEKIKDSPAVFCGGNLVPEATLPLLEKVKAGDLVVLELDSWQLQGFHDAKISPHIAVFTTFLDDHLVYYKGDTDCYFEDKIAIFKYQKSGDILIVGKQVAQKIRKGQSFVTKDSPLQSVIVAKKSDVPEDWKIKLLGEHNLENIACAIAVARVLGVSDAVLKKAVENFRGLPGRLEYLRTVKGVKIYNDNNATTSDATIAALRALNPKSEIRNPKQIPNPNSLNTKRSTLNASQKHIVLIMGGTGKGLDMSKLVAEIPKYCKGVILFKESGTDKIRDMIYDLGFKNEIEVREKETLKECVKMAMKIAQKGDTVLFSPAFASFGRWFKNEYDRGEQFVKIIDKMK